MYCASKSATVAPDSGRRPMAVCSKSRPSTIRACSSVFAVCRCRSRHACLSTWLNGGVYPTQVAEWAGHGVDVLLRIYAKCIAGQDELAKRRISEALRQD
jgi:hypothetical protein